jgi:hypothetical protein
MRLEAELLVKNTNNGGGFRGGRQVEMRLEAGLLVKNTNNGVATTAGAKKLFFCRGGW